MRIINSLTHAVLSVFLSTQQFFFLSIYFTPLEKVSPKILHVFLCRGTLICADLLLSPSNQQKSLHHYLQNSLFSNKLIQEHWTNTCTDTVHVRACVNVCARACGLGEEFCSLIT